MCTSQATYNAMDMPMILLGFLSSTRAIMPYRYFRPRKDEIEVVRRYTPPLRAINRDASGG